VEKEYTGLADRQEMGDKVKRRMKDDS